MRILLLLVLLFVSACRQSAQPTPTPANPLIIDLAVEPSPPEPGETTLIITVTNNGAPVDDLTVAVRGDMNHAGMVPVMGESDGGENGVYRVPFDFTMGGEWIITVSATTPNGETVSQTFELSV